MENTQSKKVKNPLVGSQAQPTTLDNTTKIDIDVTKALIDDIIEAGIKGGLDTSAIENFTSLSNSREQIYQVIDSMAADSSVASVIKIIAEEATEMNDQGHII
jgi:dihydrodipicolinate synthase/N-acetylneuraminate lyase